MRKLIRINLAPVEELENPYWYAPDAALLLFVILLSYFVVDARLDKIRDEIEVARIQNDELIQQNQILQSKITRFDELNKIKVDLSKKRDAVERITSSKLDRYLPVIILESIQNLKPDGIWLSSISFMNTDEQAQNSAELIEGDQQEQPEEKKQPESYNLVRIDGKGFDNMLIAEFILNLKSTFNQEPEPLDLRSLVYFDDMVIHNTKKSSKDLTIEQPVDTDPTKIISSTYKIDINSFSISFRFKERRNDVNNIDLRISNILSNINKTKRL